ncbi:MAG: CoA-binding protein [Planctomycetota bacterium]|jgi:predicted CoA-binding protein
MSDGERVAVIGASPRPERYAYQAMAMLLEHGHQPVPVAPRDGVLFDRPYCPRVEAAGAIDTATMYVGPAHQQPIIDGLLSVRPRRVIFNPGSENPAAYAALRAAGIEVVEACTLVLLRTNQY